MQTVFSDFYWAVFSVCLAGDIPQHAICKLKSWQTKHLTDTELSPLECCNISAITDSDPASPAPHSLLSPRLSLYSWLRLWWASTVPYSRPGFSGLKKVYKYIYIKIYIIFPPKKHRGGVQNGKNSVSVQQPPHSSRFGSSCTPILCQASRCDSSDIENPIDFYDFRKMLVSFTE